MSIQPANSIVQKPSDLSCLIPYIKSGRALRNEHTIMYNTPYKTKNAAGSIVRNEVSLRNLSSVRQHLFGRDSFAIHSANIDITEESIDLTGKIYSGRSIHSETMMLTSVRCILAALEKISMLSTSTNATFLSCQSSSKMQNVSSGTAKKESVSNVEEQLRGSVKSETKDWLNMSTMTEKSDERTTSDGNASLVMETCKRLNSVRFSNNKTQESTSK